MKYYKLRCDLQVSNVDKIIEFIASISDRYAYVVEGSLSDNPHLHFYLEVLDPPSRYKLRILCGSGNGGYSLSTIKDPPAINYLAYMLKTNQVTWVNIPEEIILQATQYDAKVKASLAEKRKLKKSRYKQIVEYIGPYEDTNTTLNKIIQFHLDNSLLLRRGQIATYLSTFLYTRSDEYATEFHSLILKSIMV